MGAADKERQSAEERLGDGGGGVEGWIHSVCLLTGKIMKGGQKKKSQTACTLSWCPPGAHRVGGAAGFPPRPSVARKWDCTM